MNKLSHFIIVFFAVFGACVARRCTSNDDCSLYGGSCDIGRGVCKCDISCSQFSRSGLVCQGHKKQPVRACDALSLACEAQAPIDIKDFNVLAYIRNHRKCPPESPRSMEFCEDQSYCSHHGICYKKLSINEQVCHCMDNYQGERCDLQVLGSASASSGKVSSIPELIRHYYQELKAEVLSINNFGDNEDSAKATMPPQLIATYVAIALLSLAVLICSAFAAKSFITNRRNMRYMTNGTTELTNVRLGHENEIKNGKQKTFSSRNDAVIED